MRKAKLVTNYLKKARRGQGKVTHVLQKTRKRASDCVSSFKGSFFLCLFWSVFFCCYFCFIFLLFNAHLHNLFQHRKSTSELPMKSELDIFYLCVANIFMDGPLLSPRTKDVYPQKTNLYLLPSPPTPFSHIIENLKKKNPSA